MRFKSYCQFLFRFSIFPFKILISKFQEPILTLSVLESRISFRKDALDLYLNGGLEGSGIRRSGNATGLLIL